MISLRGTLTTYREWRAELDRSFDGGLSGFTDKDAVYEMRKTLYAAAKGEQDLRKELEHNQTVLSEWTAVSDPLYMEAKREIFVLTAWMRERRFE